MSFDPCNPTTFKGPRAALVYADICEHGSLTIQFLDDRGNVFAISHCDLEEAIKFVAGVAQKLEPFVDWEHPEKPIHAAGRA